MDQTDFPPDACRAGRRCVMLPMQTKVITSLAHCLGGMREATGISSWYRSFGMTVGGQLGVSARSLGLAVPAAAAAAKETEPCIARIPCVPVRETISKHARCCHSSRL